MSVITKKLLNVSHYSAVYSKLCALNGMRIDLALSDKIGST
jgi:hypothetical protein